MTAHKPTEADQLLAMADDDATDDNVVQLHEPEPNYYAEQLRARSIYGSAIYDVPPPTWLFPGVFRKASVAMLYGPSGCGKSFLMVGLTASVMTGADWQGITPKDTGPVLYLAGEGESGLQQRLHAWSDEHGYDHNDVAEQLVTTPGGFPMHDANGWGPGIIDYATELQPRLVVIDTLHTHITGASDSEDKHMGPFVATCHNIAHATGALVVFVHHTNKGEQEYRGSTALFGNVDTVVRMTGSPATFATLQVDKQKDGKPADKWHTAFVPWGHDPENMGPLSLVAKVTTRPASTMVDGEAKRAQLLDALAAIAGPEGVAPKTWATAVQDRDGWGIGANGAPTTVFHELRRIAVAEGVVVMMGNGKATRYLPAPEPWQPSLDD